MTQATNEQPLDEARRNAARTLVTLAAMHGYHVLYVNGEVVGLTKEQREAKRASFSNAGVAPTPANDTTPRA